MARRAGGVRVLQRIDRAVDARPLAIPEREHAIMRGAGEEANLLRAPDGGGREVLVHTGLEVDVVRLELGLDLIERAVEIAERRAAIAGDVAGGVEPRRLVALVLEHGQADQRLRAGHEHLAAVEVVFVVERDGGKGHAEPILRGDTAASLTELAAPVMMGWRGPLLGRHPGRGASRDRSRNSLGPGSRCGSTPLARDDRHCARPSSRRHGRA